MPVGIVVPCFNEEVRWKPAYWATILSQPDVSLLFVDDGSTDATAGLIEQTIAGTTSRLVRLPVNGGKAEAVRQGLLDLIDAGEFSAVGYLDADGAFNAADVADLIRVFVERVVDGSFDAAWSSRVALAGRDIERSDSRHYIGRVIATFVSAGQGSIPYDTQAGYKLFLPDTRLRKCLELPFRTRWLFELEVLARWQALTGGRMRIWEEPLNYWHDVPGSKIRGREMVRVVQELVAVKSEQRRFRKSR